MPKIHSINVRALAEFTLQKGDLSMSGIERMNEGARGHRQVQAALPEGWIPEDYVTRDETVGNVVLRIHGRADAVCRSNGRVQVLEIKTTVRRPDTILIGDSPAHLAQAEIYAYLICANENIFDAEVILCYYRMDGAENHYRRSYTIAELRDAFLKVAKPYAEWLEVLDQWREISSPTLQNMKFPFENYRDGQREMAAQVYYAMRDGSRALIEAPTGIGKTAASLFGALKALGKGKVTALFYLTARTTGRRAAEIALNQLRQQGVRVRSVSITAKEKCCLLEKKDCFGCPYAADYYERRRDAIREAMHLEAADADSVHDLAVEYELCPYELSLDISEQADVIICDYNYAFDPRVRLRRYFDHKSKAGLLIDEAHNLPDRACGMLSSELSGAKIEEVRTLAARYEGADSPTVLALTQFLSVFQAEDAELEARSEPPEDIIAAAQVFADAAQQIQSPEPEVHQLMLDAAWFARIGRQFDETHYRTMILPDENYLTVRLWCFDPSEYLRKFFKRVGGTALFSATLAPINHYARQLGLDSRGEDVLLQLESPFPPENLLALTLPVSVKFNDRARTLDAVVHIIHAMCEAHAGNYLACFPSFAYLNQAYERYRAYFPDDAVMRQKSAMSEAARTQFIDAFEEHPTRSMAAFIVLGGVFAEGVDLPDDRLSGAAIISVGMPQIGFERSLVQQLYDDGFGSGYDVAFTYPGIRRVLQAAGRVIRTEHDKGVVFLVDTRYDAENIRELLPHHWHLHRIKKMDLLKRQLQRFWSPQKLTGD